MSEEDFIKVWSQSSRESILHQFYWERKELRETIDKAIEYIEEHQTKEYWADEEQLDYVDIYLDEGEIIKVIKILKGEDKE